MKRFYNPSAINEHVKEEDDPKPLEIEVVYGTVAYCKHHPKRLAYPYQGPLAPYSEWPMTAIGVDHGNVVIRYRESEQHHKARTALLARAKQASKWLDHAEGKGANFMEEIQESK